MSSFPLSTPTSYPPLTITRSQPVPTTKLFITNIPQYTILPSCASQQVSSIIRDMDYGCRDSSQMTSYACFCSTSSAHFSGVIAEQVKTACGTVWGGDGQQVTADAVGVFSRYCEMGKTVGGSVSIDVSASPTYAPTVPVVVAAATTTTRSSSRVTISGQTSNSAVESPAIPSQTPITIVYKPPLSHTITIMVVTLVPLLVILLLVTVTLFWRLRRNRMRRRRRSEEEDTKSVPVDRNSAALQNRDFHTAELSIEERGHHFVPEIPPATTTRRSLNFRFSIAELPGHDVPDPHLQEFRFT